MKKRTPLLNLLINSISARSAPQISSIKDDYTFRFSYILVTGLCNSSANSCVVKFKERWFIIFSFLTASPEAFLLRNLQTIKVRPL